MSTIANAEIAELLELSARAGRDPMLTQASAGNTSIKLRGVLWIKASGKWLADAGRGDIFIPMDLARVRGCVREGIDPAQSHAAISESCLRASVETAMHAVMPHRVVLHLHSVNTMAWAVRRDAPARLKERLEGLPWEWVPHVPSGLPLAIEIQKALSRSPGLDVFILGNHGLVLGAEDCAAAERLLREVEARLDIPARRAPGPGCTQLAVAARRSGFILPSHLELHALGTDRAARSILAGGLLFPCQAMFPDSMAPALFRPAALASSGGRAFSIIEGTGVVINPAIKPAEYAMLAGLVRVAQRIDPRSPLRYLADGEAGAASYTDAYRQLANSNHRSPAAS